MRLRHRSIRFTKTAETIVGGFVNWFSDQTAIPFGQIEELKIGGSPIRGGFDIDAFALENLKILRVALWGWRVRGGGFCARSTQYRRRGFLVSPSERSYILGYDEPSHDVAYKSSQGKEAGRLPAGAFSLSGRTLESDRDLAEGLREHVLEVGLEHEMEDVGLLLFCSASTVSGLPSADDLTLLLLSIYPTRTYLLVLL
jgi:hypothetical protein